MMERAAQDIETADGIEAPGRALPTAKEYKRRHRDLVEDAAEWRPLWEEVQRFCVPWRGRYLLSTEDLIQARLQKDIYNNIVQECITTAASGIQGILCNDGSRWFGMGHSSYDGTLAFEEMRRAGPSPAEVDPIPRIGSAKHPDRH